MPKTARRPSHPVRPAELAQPARMTWESLHPESLSGLAGEGRHRRKDIRHGKCNPTAGKGIQRTERPTAALARESGGRDQGAACSETEAA
jgi:hypothetical protein